MLCCFWGKMEETSKNRKIAEDKITELEKSNMKNKLPKYVEKILNASKQEIKEWEKYGEDIQTDQILQEVVAEQIIEAIENCPWRISILQTGGPIEKCYKRAASSKDTCEYEDTVHSQFVGSEDKIQMQLYLPNQCPVESKGDILIINKEGKEYKIPVDVVQDKEDAFITLGTQEEVAKKMWDARQNLEISTDDPVEIELLVYWRK